MGAVLRERVANQPPHLDGVKAMEAMEPRVEQDR
jgi:hypothetical protein